MVLLGQNEQLAGASALMSKVTVPIDLDQKWQDGWAQILKKEDEKC